MKPKILVVQEEIISPHLSGNRFTGGGPLSNYLLLDYLKDYFEVHILSNDPFLEVEKLEINGLFFHRVAFKKIPMKFGVVNEVLRIREYELQLSKLVNSLTLDLIICDSRFVTPCVKCADEKNIKSLAWIRAYENFFDQNLFSGQSFLKKMDYCLKKYYFERREHDAISNADIVLTNSMYMKSQIKTRFGVSALVVYPPIDMIPPLKSAYPDYNTVGFIKPEPKKGLEIVLKIAEQMNLTSFICFGKKPQNHEKLAEKLGNIRFWGWESDREKIFSKIKILLVPSIWLEPFGRVVLEAFASGVLPIISNRGGLPETAPNSSLIISDPFNIEEWIIQINRFLTNKELFMENITIGQDYIRQFSVQKQGEIFKNILMNAVKHED